LTIFTTLNPLTLKRFKKILKWFFLVLLFLIIAAYIFIRTPYGQNWIGQQVTKKLSKSLGTKVTVKRVSFSLLNNMHLEGLMVEDKLGDTILYAGNASVRITDWFVFKKEAELKYIGLEDALIKFQRLDSSGWRHQFVFDFFGSSGSTEKKEGGLKLNLKKAALKNVTFVKKDKWLGDDLSIQLNALDLDADKLNLSGNQFEINSLIIDKPIVSIANYKKLKPSDTISVKQIVDELIQPVSWNKSKTLVKVGTLKITNGVFKTDKETIRPPFDYFDGKHILFSDINVTMDGASFVGDTVYSKLILTAKERSGLEVKNLSANVKMTPQGMEFDKMLLQTNRSTLRHYFSMSYDDMSDMGDFIHKVKLSASFDSTYIDSDDIAFFAPKLNSWKKKIILKGKVRGKVDDLIGRDMVVQAGNSTLLNGDITLTGLPDINETFIDFKANHFKTTYSDAVTIVPALRRITNPRLNRIQYVNFKGSFTGFIKDFVTYGTIQTNLGTVKSDLNMKLPPGQQPVYAGNIETDDFKLGEFLGDNTLGSVSLKAKLKGTGFIESKRNVLVDGNISHVDYKNYRYKDIAINGRLDKKMFEGTASIHDPNVDLALDGTIDFNKKTPRFDLRSNITTIDLRKLGFTKDSVFFKGNLDVNFDGASIEDFVGTASISNAELINGSQRLPFDSLVLNSTYESGVKKLTAVANEMQAAIEGDFKLNELSDATAYLLNKYYPSYIKAPKKFPAGQNFSFDITTYYVDEYLKLINPKLAGFNNSHFTGRLNTYTSQLALNAYLQQFQYGQYTFDEVNITAAGNGDSLLVTGGTQKIHINDSLHIPFAQFQIAAANDISKITINTGANQAVEKANINAVVKTFTDGVDIEFDPSDFTLNGKQWTVDKDGVLRFRKNSAADGQLVISDGNQKIELVTERSNVGNWSNLKAKLTNINLADIQPYIMPKNRLEGLLSGNILVENPGGNMKISSSDIRTKHLRLDNDSLGEINAAVDYDKITKELKLKGSTANQENNLSFDGKIFIGDKEKERGNKIALKAKKFEIKILERFLGNLFSNMQGYLTGDVDLEGAFKQLAITGKGRLENAGLKINFTQCFYKIKDTEISLTPEEINLNGLVLTDTITKNAIYLRGGIDHNSFRDMLYDINISTRKPNTTDVANNKPVLLLNTTYKDNKQFYGKVFGTGSMTLVGPQNNMYMKIDAVASEKDSSYVTLPPAASRESGIADFLIERKYGREMTDADVAKSTTNIIYDVDITANPAVTATVQIDELTGDQVKGRGTGSLNIRSGTAEPLSLRGRFDIQEGDYLFTFQSIVKKPFKLKTGGNNYIMWDGDAYKAQVNIDAYYEAVNVSFQPLADALSISNSGLANERGNVYVVANMRGDLFKPDFSFKLDFPETNRIKNDPSLAISLQQLESDINALNKQVAFLIVLNSFAPTSLDNSTYWSTTIVNNVTQSAYSSISGLLFNEINKAINSAFSKIFNNKVGFNITSSLYNRNLLEATNSNLAPNLDINIPISLSNRFNINVGQTIDLGYANGNSTTDVLRWLPDVSLEWKLNEKGNLIASIFYRENNDFLTANANGSSGRAKRVGANISYRKEANNFWELFFRRKNKDNNPPTAIDSTSSPAAKQE
jgi:hypothetical protein